MLGANAPETAHRPMSAPESAPKPLERAPPHGRHAGRVTEYPVRVMFSDCDPAGIVFFANFSRWMDASSLDFFMQCGVPPWHELERRQGIVGTPLLEIQVRFLRPATYGESLRVLTRVAEWREKVFIQHHRVVRGDDLLCEGTETRAFCVRDPADPKRLRAVPVPEFVRVACA